MRTWCVVPTMRPSMKGRVLSNFNRQRYPNKTLLVVENGPAVGAYSPEECHVIDSEPHQSLAKNRAIEFLKRIAPGDFISFMDDDDFYGENYLTEQLGAARRGKITGKRAGWIAFNDGVVYFGANWTPGPTEFLMGPSIGCFVADAQEFPVKCAEEHGFIHSALDAGLSVETLSPLHLCVSREGKASEHTHQASDEKIWRYSGVGVRSSLTPLSAAHMGALCGPGERHQS